jgi:hypothetical protein
MQCCRTAPGLTTQRSITSDKQLPEASPSVFVAAPTTPPTPPTLEPWNELAAFRETTLRHFTRPEDRACLERLGELLTESALEQAHLWPATEGSETTNGVAAACRDLHHTLRFLTSLGDARHLSTLSQPEHVLADIAARAARRLRPELGRLGEALNRCLAQMAGRVN